MESTPLTNGSTCSRDAGGRFTKGNAGGPGNPYARRVAQLRSALFDAVGEEDLRDVVRALLTAAKAADVAAAKELLLRVLGPPVDHELLGRLDELEKRIEELTEKPR